MKLLVVFLFVVAIAHSHDFQPSEDDKDSIHFFESFDDASSAHWIRSKDARYTGNNAIEISEEEYSFGKDHLMRFPEPARFYGVSAPISTPVLGSEWGEKPLVVQYEVRFSKDLDCGGAYLKLLTANASLDLRTLTDTTPFTIMFGPDRCGANNKVHFIMRHRNPITGECEEKHMKAAPLAKTDGGVTHLYTLILRPDGSFEVRVDGTQQREGNVMDDFDPPVNPPREIDDPEDVKPSDWVDEAEIEDPDATKPEDWDEDAPETIPDPDATMPEEWQEDAPETIPDPVATKPEDWDDEMDGDWIAPEVPNPVCLSHGCGKWTAPNVPNPAYKGPWMPPMIPNPLYRGEFVPKRIANPAYFYDATPVRSLQPIGAVAFEIWTMTPGISFDNVLIASDVAVAEKIADAAWRPKYDAEEKVRVAAEKAAAKLQEEQQKQQQGGSGVMEGLMATVREVSETYVAQAMRLYEEKPNVAIGAATAVIGVVPVLALLCCCRRRRSSVTGGRSASKENEKKSDEKKSNVNEEKPKTSKSPNQQLKARKGKAPKDDN